MRLLATRVRPALLALPLALVPCVTQDDGAGTEGAGPAETVRWEVVVVDEHGDPVFDAELVLDPLPEEFEAAEGRSVRLVSHRSDPDGIVELDLAPEVARRGRVELGSVSPRVPVEFPANASEEARRLEVALTIHPDTTFEGRVVSAVDGEPLVGVEVLVASSTGFRSYGGSRPLPLSVDARSIGSTTREGAFRFDERSWRTTSVRLAHPGFAPAIVPMGIDGHAFEQDEPIALEPEVRITGRIAFDGLPDGVVEGARIQASFHGAAITRGDDPYRFGGSNHFGASSSIAADGTFELAGLPGDTPLEVLVLSGSRTLHTVAERLELAPGAVHEIDLVVDTGRVVRGVVVDPVGTPLAGETVWLAETRNPTAALSVFDGWEGRSVLATATTDEAGRFAFEEVAAGVRRVGLAHSEGEGAPLPLARTVEIAEVDPDPIVLVAHRELFIGGEVRGPDGAPFAGYAQISASGPVGSVEVVSEDGTFRIGPLSPGDWRLSVFPTKGVDGGPIAARSGSVPARAGAPDVVIELPAGGALELVPVDADGALVPSQVQLFTADDQRSWSSSTSGSRGMRLRNLHTGRFTAVATTASGLVGILPFVVEPNVDAGRVEIPMVEGGTLELAMNGADEDDLLTVCVHHEGRRIAFATLFGSRETTITVPVGTLEVRTYARDDVHASEPLAIDEVVALPGRVVRHELSPR